MRTDQLSYLLLMTWLFISACDKKKDEDPAPTNTTPTPTAPVVNAYFSANRVVTYYNGVPATASNATVLTNDGSGLPVDAGHIACNSLQLDSLFSGFYSLSSNNSSLDFPGGDVTWNGGGRNGYPDFTYNASGIAFPDGGMVTSGDTIHKSAGYVFSCASITGADSVTFSLFPLAKTLHGNATSCSFSASELSSLSTGTAYATISARTYASHDLGSKHGQFTKARTVAKSLVVVD